MMDETQKKKFFYLNTSHAIQIHEWLIEHAGGFHGIKDPGQLECSLTHIQNDDYYPKIEDKLTHLVFSTSKNHSFYDGNKRLSLLLGATFLDINGFGFLADDFVKEMENIIVWVAENVIDKELLRKIITSFIYEGEFSEEVKLEILNAVSKAQTEHVD